jgi:hypothetical protein
VHDKPPDGPYLTHDLCGQPLELGTQEPRNPISAPLSNWVPVATAPRDALDERTAANAL